MANESIVLSPGQAEYIYNFLLRKVRLEEPYSDEDFRIFLAQSTPNEKTVLAEALLEIHRSWNSGYFTDFSRYLELDDKLHQKHVAQAGKLILPNLFARAQRQLIDHLKSKTYKEQFNSYNAELRNAGGYDQILKQREAIRIETLKKELEEQKRREQEAGFRKKLIISCFPERWNQDAHEISSAIGLDVSIDEIEAEKISVAKEWFRANNLDVPSDEQAAVITNCQNSLRVVARAGSGKTRTIALKVLFLVYFLGYRTDEIIALAFNDKAQQELHNRIELYRERACLPSHGPFRVMTFDALAWNLVNPAATVLKAEQQSDLIKEIVLHAIDNEEGLREEVERLLVNSFKSDWEKITRSDPMQSKAYLERLRSWLTETTLDGKSVKSKAEKRIADFLFEHDIPYCYELPFAVDDGNFIRPDFYLPTHRVVIEYCGIVGDLDYEDLLKYKRTYWDSKREITLIEIKPGHICRQDVSYDSSREHDYHYLTDLLSQRTHHLHHPIQITRLTDEEVLAKLRDHCQLMFVKLLQSAIARAGEMNLSEDQLLSRLTQFQAATSEERAFLNMLPRFIAMYQDRLANNNLTDFSTIKKMAIAMIESGRTVFDYSRGTVGIDLKLLRLIFVDEFQDFSELFRGLLLAILKSAPNALVNAVGDDWQMINRFAGSKPELFEQFDKDYPKPQTLYLQTNYRSSDAIVDFCNAIMQANGATGRPAIASKPRKEQSSVIASLERDAFANVPRELAYFKGDSTLAAIFRLLKPLTEEFQPSSKNDGDHICLTISRTNNPPLETSAHALSVRASTNREVINAIVNRNVPDDVGKFFEAVTGHKSKGIEADSVIVLGPKQFPMIHKSSHFLRFFGDTLDNLLRDELNLFYVTCSRARRHLFFLPERNHMMSPFLERIRDRIESIGWEQYPCRLAAPAALHIIQIQNREGKRGALFEATDLLIAHEFADFHRPNKIPTRSRIVRKDLYSTLALLRRIVQACSDYDLSYVIRDGLNQEVFRFPGPTSIQEAMAAFRPKQ